MHQVVFGRKMPIFIKKNVIFSIEQLHVSQWGEQSGANLKMMILKLSHQHSVGKPKFTPRTHFVVCARKYCAVRNTHYVCARDCEYLIHSEIKLRFVCPTVSFAHFPSPSQLDATMKMLLSHLYKVYGLAMLSEWEY